MQSTLRWYEYKDVAPTTEAEQKMVGFFHNKKNNMLKPGDTSPNLANNGGTILPVWNSIPSEKAKKNC